MKITERPSLQALNTFGVPAHARLLVELETEEDVLYLPPIDPARDLVLGGGSNILFVEDVPGTVFLNRIRGIDVVETSADAVRVEIGAGENWHAFVRRAIDEGWHGLENLSLIPGLAGAAPIQNIGAYGVELSSVLESVTAWDRERSRWAVLSTADCALSYRDSLFKSAAPDRYLITSIRLRLPLNFTPRTEYPGLTAALRDAGISGPPTAREVSDAVIRLRQSKLPDPAKNGNAGSFFKNPVVTREGAAVLREQEPGLPSWPLPDGSVKLSAAWLVERCDLKGRHEGGASVADRHALVLINRDAASGQDVWRLAQHVMDAVEKRFGIRLDPEPRVYRGRVPV